MEEVQVTPVKHLFYSLSVTEVFQMTRDHEDKVNMIIHRQRVQLKGTIRSRTKVKVQHVRIPSVSHWVMYCRKVSEITSEMSLEGLYVPTSFDQKVTVVQNGQIQALLVPMLILV